MTNFEMVETLLNFVDIEDFNRMNLKCISFTKTDTIIYFDLGTICVPKKMLGRRRENDKRRNRV